MVVDKEKSRHLLRCRDFSLSFNHSFSHVRSSQMSKKSFSRRGFLKASVVATAGVVLAACTPPSAPQAGSQTGAAQPAKQGVKLHFFNRGGEYVFQTMDLQIAAF